MKILIIGGAGFQGSHMVEKWLAAGHDLTVLNTWSERSESNMKPFAGDIKLVWGSITDPEIVNKTVREHEVVVQLAARVNVDESINQPGMVTMVNVMGTHHILEACKAHGARLIHGSSCEVYGSAKPLPVTENSALMPHSPYAASKAGADRLCYAYYETFGMDVSVMRPCNIYGERQKEGVGGAVISIFTRLALEGKPLKVFGDGLQTREYMHVKDVVDAYDIVLNRNDVAGQTFNAGTGETISIKDIANFVASRTGVAVEHAAPRAGEVPEFMLDSSKIRALGFEPKIKFWDGIERYVEWRKALAGSLAGAAAH
jgi:dTDP-glucose 4,6-dehydratase